MTQLGLSGQCGVRDLWQHKDLGNRDDEFSIEVRPHGAQLFRIHPASRLAGVRYNVTSSTVDKVAASMATHISPMLLVVRATSIVAMNIWYML